MIRTVILIMAICDAVGANTYLFTYSHIYEFIQAENIWLRVIYGCIELIDKNWFVFNFGFN